MPSRFEGWKYYGGFPAYQNPQLIPFEKTTLIISNATLPNHFALQKNLIIINFFRFGSPKLFKNNKVLKEIIYQGVAIITHPYSLL